MRAAAKGKTRTPEPTLDHRGALGRRRPGARKLASGDIHFPPTSHRGVKRRKSKKARWMRREVRQSRVGSLFHRWYEAGTGRYGRADPVGRLGEPHPYAYARSNPAIFADFLGQKSRTCCTPIQQTIGLSTFKHCFIQTEDDQGSTTTRSLHGMGTPRRSWGGPIGCTFENDFFDRDAPDNPGFNCGEWKEDCGTDDCVRNQAAQYPRSSRYRLRGPNSSTFAGTITRACGLDPPSVVGVRTPGWNRPTPPGLFLPSLGGGLYPLPCPLQR